MSDADDSLAVLKAQVLKMRHMATQQTVMSSLLPPDTPSFVACFAECSARMMWVAADALDEAIKLHRETHAALGDPRPSPRPTLRIIESS